MAQPLDGTVAGTDRVSRRVGGSRRCDHRRAECRHSQVERHSRKGKAAGAAAGKVAGSRGAVECFGQRDLESPQHSRRAGFDSGPYPWPDLRTGCRLLDVWRGVETGDGRDPLGRGKGCGGGRHRSAAASSRGGRLLHGPRTLGRQPRLTTAIPLSRNACFGRRRSLDCRRSRLSSGQGLSRSRHGTRGRWGKFGCATYHHPFGRRLADGDSSGVGGRRDRARRHRHVGHSHHRHSRRLRRDLHLPLDLPGQRPRYGAQGYLRSRHERRRGLGTDGAVSRLRTGRTVPHAAVPG